MRSACHAPRRPPRAFERLRTVDTLQPPYLLFRRDIERDISPYCQEHGVGVFVYGPLAHGLLAGGCTPQTSFATDDWRGKTSNSRALGSRRTRRSWNGSRAWPSGRASPVSQLAVARVLANPDVDIAIVGARNSRQIEHTAPAAEIHLSPETLDEIEQIMRGAVPVGGPSPEGMEVVTVRPSVVSGGMPETTWGQAARHAPRRKLCR